MPFSEKRNKLSQKRKTSIKYILSHKTLELCLSRNRTLIQLPQVTTASFFLERKRAASFAFLNKAFVSIEAATFLSIFLIAVLGVLSFGTIMNQKMRLEVALRNTASKIAQDYAIYDAMLESDSKLIQDYAVRGVGIIAAKQLFTEELGKDKLDKSCIVDGNPGISFLYSDIVDDEGYVDLVIAYKMDFPFKLVPIPELKMTQRCRIHAWTGVSVFNEDDENEEYVYVTSSGTVYHVSLSCKHLNIQITKLNVSEVGSVRNNSGGKYYACQICCNDSGGTIVYVTKSGTAYHNSKDCPSLIRNVNKVPKSDCIGMPACKSCGG